jgi:MoaA/NifB/PqqE/SkfB family radical SAM enzyme
MKIQSPYQTYKRFRTLQTDTITSLPIVILMPHSACNCRCVMCDIWKGNHNLKQLSEADIQGLLDSLRKYETKQVLMTGGEAILHANFFRFCEILKKEKIKISLLSTGLTMKKNAHLLVDGVDDIIVSLDGNEEIHNRIRNIPGAYLRLREGIEAVKSLKPSFPVSGRTVIQKLNFRHWAAILESAKQIGLNTVSFLPADVSSTAFNRAMQWELEKQHQIMLGEEDLGELGEVVEDIIDNYKGDFVSHFIVESPAKLRNIYQYYAACHGFNDFPYKKCNAPWVSTVIEADGTVRPCFFHNDYGNIKSDPLDKIINSPQAIRFRKNLDMAEDETCKKCVCYLNLKPHIQI